LNNRKESFSSAHSVCQVLGGKNTTQSLLIVNDKNAVGPLCRAELTCFGDTDGVWNRKRWTGLERRDGAFGSVQFTTASAVTLLSG